MFIYKITCSVNNKCIIGQTRNPISKRWAHYRNELKRNNHYNSYLQKAWNKYGESNFVFEILDEVYFENSLDNLEIFWIKFFDSTNPSKGYNLESGGKKNKKQSDETRKKISNSLKGLIPWQKGKPRTPEANKKQSVSMLGKIPVNRKSVQAINLETKEVHVFESATSAGRFFQTTHSSISNYCLGKKSKSGWMFSYIAQNKIKEISCQ